MHLHQHNACNGTIYLTTLATPYLPCIHFVSLPDTPTRPIAKFFQPLRRPARQGFAAILPTN
ncbi:hypothetical protein VL15_29275 [Burkholderia cepacia]|uniref:Uncharacterized protein n=1 Tax=Burkholderia cepacia TaxID=292 RepID=A0A0J5ZF14_BURCE|nr:hypothetical protein VL15_29275 [Burkholderia cepacia]